MRRLAVILAVFVLASCAGTVPQPRALIAAAIPTAVRIEFGGTSCSATAIGRDLLLTAAHCHVPDEAYTVVTREGTRLLAELVRASPLHDLAILRVPGADFRPIQLAPDDSIAPGDTVYAVGQPFGLGWSVSRGIVSYIGREIEQLNSGLPLIQFDASIHPGSSGGALLDEFGRLVGVTIGGRTSFGAHGIQINFAVPVVNVRQLLQEVTT